MMRRFLLVLGAAVFYLTSAVSNAQNIDADSLSARLKQGVDDTTEVNILNEIAFNYVYSNPSIAQDDVAIALKKAVQINYKKGQARSYNVLGGINWAKGDYAQSLDYYIESSNKYVVLDDRVGLAKSYNNIGEIYKKLNDLGKALEYHEKALDIWKKLYGNDMPLMSYINIAEIYLAQDSLGKAERYYNYIILNPDTTNFRKLAYAYIGLGQIALKRKDYVEANGHYFRALELRERMGENRGIADSHIKIGNMLRMQGLYESAEVYFDKALKMAYQIEAKDLTMDALMGKTLVDSLQNDHKSALKNYWRYTAVKDSTFNKQKSDQIALMQTTYETELLKRENEANQIKVKQQNTLVIGVIMALILSASVAVAFYKQRKTQVTVNKLLAAKNLEINDRNVEIETQSEKAQSLNKSLESLNGQLEEKVRQRTKMLSQQNEVLSQYAFTNAHELRAPVANILGLVHLLEKTELNERESDVVLHLKKATDQLDAVIKDIRQRLERSEELLEESSSAKS